MKCPGCGTAGYREAGEAAPCPQCGWPDRLPQALKLGNRRPDGTWEPPPLRPLGAAAIAVWGVPVLKALVYAAIMALFWTQPSYLQALAGYGDAFEFNKVATTWIVGALALAVVLIILDFAAGVVSAQACRQQRVGWWVYPAIQLLPFLGPLATVVMWGRYSTRPWVMEGWPFL